jgi:hemerythrin superfamily protein
MRVTDLIRDDHQTVHRLFFELEQTPPANGDARQEILDRIAEELEVHAQAEEAVFYPAVRAISRRIDDAEAGHAHLRSVMGSVEGLDPSSEEFVLKARQLKQVVLNHAAEEESGIFMDAERLGAEELERLGREFAERKETLKTSVLQRGIRAIKQAAQKAA